MPQTTNETSSPEQTGTRQIAEGVRRACIEEVLRSYEDAQMRGLCAEGAWEVAVGALRTLDLDAVLCSIADNAHQEDD